MRPGFSGRSSRSSRGPRRPGREGRPGGDRDAGGGRFPRRKLNRFFTVFPEGSDAVNYKDTERLGKFLTEKGKILPRRITGLTNKQQRLLARAIKRSRHAGLLAFQLE